MPKRRVLSGDQVIRILEANGFVRVRQSGSHVKMARKMEAGTISAVVPLHYLVKTGTLTGMIRQSRLSRSLFE